jgi:hypothetical protein
MRIRLLKRLRRRFGRHYIITMEIEKGVLYFNVTYRNGSYKTNCLQSRSFCEAKQYIARAISKDIYVHFVMVNNKQEKIYSVTCRYGVHHNVVIKGNKAAVQRTIDMLSQCCCFVCFNHNCNNPKDEKIDGCNNVCKLFTNTPYCKK